jgi:hypothetical protein
LPFGQRVAGWFASAPARRRANRSQRPARGRSGSPKALIHNGQEPCERSRRFAGYRSARTAAAERSLDDRRNALKSGEALLARTFVRSRAVAGPSVSGRADPHRRVCGDRTALAGGVGPDTPSVSASQPTRGAPKGLSDRRPVPARQAPGLPVARHRRGAPTMTASTGPFHARCGDARSWMCR